MRPTHIVLCVLMGCYSVRVPSEVPCASNGACPSEQVCDFSRSPPTCVEHLGEETSDVDALVVGEDAPNGLAPWGPPSLVVYTPAASGDDDVTLTADMLELYFNRAGDIYAIVRSSLADPWSQAAIVSELSTQFAESTPELSPDGLTIFFSSNRPGSAGVDIWVATRATRNDPWGAPVLATGLNSPAADRCAAPSLDPDMIVLASNRNGGEFDLFISRRSNGEWSVPMVLAETNSLEMDSAPFAIDGRLIFFFSDRAGSNDLYEATADPAGRFYPAPITELNSDLEESDPWVSVDGRHMFFVRGVGIDEGTRDNAIYESVR